MKPLYVTLLALSLLLVGCGTHKKSTVNTKSKRNTPVVTTKPPVQAVPEEVTPETPPAKTSGMVSIEDYIAAFSAIAVEEMQLYGIPASITLAQGILESSAGKGRLAVEANNHFGIKCHDWTGDRIYHDDDAAQECFRKYNNAKYSYRDHSLFLKHRKRYSKLFTLDITDYKGWARELKAAGYATDRKYPDKLISLIERYALHQFDTVTASPELAQADSESYTEPTEQHRVRKGDTLYSISRKYNTTVERLKQLNGLTDTTLSIGQVLQVKP